MTSRTNIHSGAPWESIVGYCRAVRHGSSISVSGTAPVGPDGDVIGPGDPYLQAKRCIEIIAEALQGAGAQLEDVVRTRMYVTDIGQWEAIAKAHREAFGEVSPATTMVQVTALIDPAMLVEIEADAVVGDG